MGREEEDRKEKEQVLKQTGGGEPGKIKKKNKLKEEKME